MTTGFRRLLRNLVSSGELAPNTARQMLAELLPSERIAVAEGAVISAAMNYLEAASVEATGPALDGLIAQCRWLKDERAKLDPENGRGKA